MREETVLFNWSLVNERSCRKFKGYVEGFKIIMIAESSIHHSI